MRRLVGVLVATFLIAPGAAVAGQAKPVVAPPVTVVPSDGLPPQVVDNRSNNNVHVIRHDVAEQTLIMGDDQKTALGIAERVHAFRHHLQRVDVEAGIGFVQDRDARLKQGHL